MFCVCFSFLITILYLIVTINAKNILDTEIELTLVRHAQACHNAISNCRKANRECKDKTYINNVREQLLDAPLTNFGISQGKNYAYYAQSNAKLNAPDIVITSSLMRNIQSALLSYPNRTNIYQVPYIKETGGSGRNDPETLSQQTAYLKTAFSQYNPNRINTTLIGDSPIDTSDWEMFKKWFVQKIIANQFEFTSNENGKIKVTVFSHCSFMRDHIIKDDVDNYDCLNLYSSKFIIKNGDLLKLNRWNVVGRASVLRPDVCRAGDGDNERLKKSDFQTCFQKYNTIYEDWFDNCFSN